MMKSISGVLAVVVALGCGEQSGSAETSLRDAAVAEAGAQIMPFDLERTTHTFEKIAAGGRQRVVADENDVEQMRLIRAHLAEESERFARGDFHDPAMIHGDDMPGLHALVMGADRISMEYSETDGGGQILYTTKEPDLIVAIHDWFDAQVSDHGAHAQPGGTTDR